MVDMLPLEKRGNFIEVGSGSGTGTAVLAQRAPEGSTVVAIDNSDVMIDLARRQFEVEPLPAGVSVNFVACGLHEAAQHLPKPFDGVVAFNTVHLIGPMQETLQQLSLLVKPGGFVAFCSGYTTRSISTTDGLQMLRMLQTIRNKAGTDADPKQDECSYNCVHEIRVKHLESNMQEANLKLAALAWESVELCAHSLVEFFSVPGMLGGRIPRHLSKSTVRGIVREAVDACGITSISRKWLFVVAQRI
jgi:SAM-dependent methyltransferase